MVEDIGTDDLTPEEMELYQQLVAGNVSPSAQEKDNMISFFKNIISTQDTTKVSNLKEEELESVRIFQSAALYSDSMGLDKVANFLRYEAEIILATSNSKKGFLINAAITTRKSMESTTKAASSGGGTRTWLGKKKV